MFYPDISQYTESLLNPQGRFRSLTGVVPRVDGQGMPLLHSNANRVTFRVTVDGAAYLMKCILKEEGPCSAAMLYEHIAGQRPEFLPRTAYLYKEMYVFDNSGSGQWVDVILEEDAPHRTVDVYLNDACLRRDYDRLDTAARQVCLMTLWKIDADLCHGMISPSNVRVGDDGRVRLANFDFASIGSLSDVPSHPDHDNLACLCLWAHTLRIAPQVAGMLEIEPSDPIQVKYHREKIVALASEIVPLYGSDAAKGLFEHVWAGMHDPERLRGMVEALLSGNEPVVRLHPPVREEQPTPEAAKKEPVDLSRYEWAGQCSEGTYCVMNRDRWGFVSEHGEQITPLIYDWADDFHEGRAAVMKDDLYGLIDKQGNEVIPLQYEDLQWEWETGIAMVARDGRYGFMNRMGEKTVAFRYSWVGEPSGGLIAVQYKGKYGYVDKDGEMVIDAQFDDAYSFDGGKALVVKDNERYYIDAAGDFFSY